MAGDDQRGYETRYRERGSSATPSSAGDKCPKCGTGLRVTVRPDGFYGLPHCPRCDLAKGGSDAR